MASWHEWGAYFLYHYEEYLTSDFFINVVDIGMRYGEAFG